MKEDKTNYYYGGGDSNIPVYTFDYHTGTYSSGNVNGNSSSIGIVFLKDKQNEKIKYKL